MPTVTNKVTGNENAIEGVSVDGRGVVGTSETNYGIRAHSKKLSGIRSSSDEGTGVEGESRGAGSGVVGTSTSGYGVYGKSVNGRGVVGTSETDYGIRAHSRKLSGIRSSSDEGGGVEGESKGGGTGVVGISNSGVGVHGKGGRLAGFFEGDVKVTGDISLANADCAEDFDVTGADEVGPGTVMVLGNDGALSESQQAYDKRVAGVISGAGNYKPGIVLDKQETSFNRKPIALLGKVYCKVDAQYASIEIGDLLTTSSSPGHAMKASDHKKAFGAVIGKALRPLKEGQGLIPILIALQ